MRVLKFGGASLASPHQVKQVAKKLAQFHRQGEKLIVVVSAMGTTTNELIQLAHQISPAPSSRELDMLLSTGERIAMALMSMALKEHGCAAISFTGSQAGILTDNRHSNARIQSLSPLRVQEEISRGKIVVLAGFQGVCPETKEITTLGRGGSDTTAVAMAAHFKADQCEIRKEVQGFYSINPHFSNLAKLYPQLTFSHLVKSTYWGAQLLHHRSAALAKKFNVPLLIGSADFNSCSTVIQPHEDLMLEKESFFSAHSLNHVALIKWNTPVKGEPTLELIKWIENSFASVNLPIPRVIFFGHQSTGMHEAFELLLQFESHLEDQSLHLLKEKGFEIRGGLAMITLLGNCGSTIDSLKRSLEILGESQIRPLGTFTQPDQLQFVVTSQKSQEATTKLHDFWIKSTT